KVVILCNPGASYRLVPIRIGAIIRPRARALQKLAEFRGGHMLRKPRCVLRRDGSIIRYRRAVSAPTLGGDNNYPRGTACSINGRGRAILQHIHTGDIVRIHGIDVRTYLPVDNDQWRSIGTQRRQPAKADGVSGIGVATWFGNRQASYLALQ